MSLRRCVGVEKCWGDMPGTFVRGYELWALCGGRLDTFVEGESAEGKVVERSGI